MHFFSVQFSQFSLSFFAAMLIVSPTAMAEKADRTKPINIEAKRGTIDEANKVRTIEGDVILIQGTMRIAAERMVVKEDTTGNISAQAFGSAAGQIAFKQKREGFSDFVDGVADRAEFDDKASTLKLFGRARLTSAGDVAEGEYIYFNTATEVYAIRNSAADDKPGAIQTDTSGRVKITIQPRVRETTETKSSTEAPAPK
jgi:lipopolysaccharide export system protein LptA